MSILEEGLSALADSINILPPYLIIKCVDMVSGPSVPLRTGPVRDSSTTDAGLMTDDGSSTHALLR